MKLWKIADTFTGLSVISLAIFICHIGFYWEKAQKNIVFFLGFLVAAFSICGIIFTILDIWAED
jgi:hypothetical protein